jgi:effector-binding domain-containing protein
MKHTLLFTVVLALGGSPAMAIETPDHVVLEDHQGVQLRAYTDQVVVETEVESAFDEAGNRAFRRLFNYISGANERRMKIAMTAPVTQELSVTAETATPVDLGDGRQGWRVAFLIPADIPWSEVPAPRDERVTVRRIPGRTMAAIRFSGSWSTESFQRRHDELVAFMEARGWQADGPAVYARYNAPYTPSFLRRNEVLIPVAVPASE